MNIKIILIPLALISASNFWKLKSVQAGVTASALLGVIPAPFDTPVIGLVRGNLKILGLEEMMNDLVERSRRYGRLHNPLVLNISLMENEGFFYFVEALIISTVAIHPRIRAKRRDPFKLKRQRYLSTTCGMVTLEVFEV